MKRRMLHTFVLVGCCVAVCMGGVGCQRTVPPVPSTGRTVVPPQGSTNVLKPWNRTTKQEGDAILGPLSNERR